MRLASRTSRSGEPSADYCGVNEMLATCEAVIAALAGVGAGCTVGDPAACPEGGRCATVAGGTTNRCTYDCNDILQCPASPDLMSCPLGGGYCGGT